MKSALSTGILLPVLLMTSAAIAEARPEPADKVGTARWMAHTFTWGFLGTTSTRTAGTTVGDSFGNPYSFADVGGTPYFFASDLDASMVDIFGAKKSSRASFSLSEAQLTGTSGAVSGCEIGSGFNDPENPPCGRLVLSGLVVKLADNTTEAKAAMSSLIKRHPSFAQYAGLGFYIAKMEVDDIFFLDGYGGADPMKPSDYFGANRTVDPPHKPDVTPPAPGPPMPAPADKVGTARWMARTFTYGALTTVSTRSDGSTVGDAFANPYSFADNATGVPYFFASDLDASMIDLFVASGAKPRASFALSEAQLTGDREIGGCHIGTGFDDPENPPCGRLILSGRMIKLADNSTEAKEALVSLIARHPSFGSYSGLHFYVVKMEVDGIFFLDGYGGANIMKPADYFAANVTAETVLV